MVVFPSCKINLGLQVIGKRPDGFHDISTCFYPVPWSDVLEIVPSKDFSFSSSGDPIPGATADNLCVRAYELLRKDFNLKPVAIHLLKTVPIGAGLGGGSSDGASALMLLNDLFELALTGAQLESYAAQLGSDCPFFIRNTPMLGTGRGEILTPVQVSLKDRFLVIVTPEVQISTAGAFAKIIPRTAEVDVRTIVENHRMSDWKLLLRNDFEPALFQQFPLIDAIHKKLYAFGATFASLSGSGSSVFGIFDSERDLRDEFGSVRYWSGKLS